MEQKANEHSSIDETTRFYRDLLIKILGSGAVGLLVIAGWLLSGDHRFLFVKTAPLGSKERALGLTVLSILGWGGWFVFA